MKVSILVITLLLGGAVTMPAQEAAGSTPGSDSKPAPASPPAPSATPPVDAAFVRTSAESVVLQTKLMERVFGVQVELGGAVSKALQAENPLQLFNPFAPAEYGDGFDNVTVDPQTGRATGFSIFEIRF